jgi:methionyl-tRNA formyltransferase
MQGVQESSNFYFNSQGLAVKTCTKMIVITHLQFPGKNVITSQDAANSYAEFFTN